MLSRFRVRRLAALAVLAAVVAACTVDPVDHERVAETSALLAAAQPVYGDTYIDSLLGDISSLIPSITSDAASHTVGGLIYSGLVRFDGLKAGLCEFRLPDFDAGDTFDGAATDWIELFVTDAKDRPRAGIAAELVFKDGSTRSAASDESGLIRVERLKSGPVQVRFPDAEAERVASGGKVPKAAPPGNAALEFQLQDVDGKPVSGVRFVAESPDGTEREGVTDDQGRGRIERVEEGEHLVSFPDVDASAWEAA